MCMDWVYPQAHQPKEIRSTRRKAVKRFAGKVITIAGPVTFDPRTFFRRIGQTHVPQIKQVNLTWDAYGISLTHHFGKQFAENFCIRKSRQLIRRIDTPMRLRINLDYASPQPQVFNMRRA